jgi:paraquat-inducible protein A
MTNTFSGAGGDMRNDIDIGKVLCTVCGTLSEPAGAEMNCPVCSNRIMQRKRASISRTWALTVASVILYIPANIFPVMGVEFLGDSSQNTILQGVIQFYQHEMYLICVVVFVASFVVPLFKMASLFYLLATVKGGGRLSRLQKTKLYSIVEIIGKWSMLDVYVVAIMSGLIKTGYMVNITGGIGIVFFSAVVILTMLASASFDTRLIWDKNYA